MLEASATPAPETALEDLTRHLETSAAGYFRASGAARVRRLTTLRRRNATLHFFEVQIAGSSHRVVAKLPFGRNQAGGRHQARQLLPDELRIFPVSDTARGSDLEAVTLAWIHRHFAAGDPRFGAIRVLEYLPDQQVLVMQACPDPNLWQLYLRRIGPLRRLGPPGIGSALANAGAWLRVFHELPAPPGSRERTRLRADFLASIERMTGYLLESTRAAGFLDRVRSAIRSRARDALPDALPLVTGHGDFVPRNVLVGPGGRVTILDTRAQWQAPRYEDIARFRVALAASDAQLASPSWAFDRGAPELAGAEFLEGYFAGEAPPLDAIRLFECQRLLSIWVAAAHQQRIARRSRRRAKALALAVRARFVRRELGAILPEARGDG